MPRRAWRLLFALGLLLILLATSGAQQRPPILEKLTKTYESFEWEAPCCAQE